MIEDITQSFAQNGPWAVAAGFLLHQVIKAWTNDRQQLIVLLTEFKDAMTALKMAVNELREEMRDLRNGE